MDLFVLERAYWVRPHCCSTRESAAEQQQLPGVSFRFTLAVFWFKRIKLKQKKENKTKVESKKGEKAEKRGVSGFGERTERRRRRRRAADVFGVFLRENWNSNWNKDPNINTKTKLRPLCLQKLKNEKISRQQQPRVRRRRLGCLRIHPEVERGKANAKRKKESKMFLVLILCFIIRN